MAGFLVVGYWGNGIRIPSAGMAPLLYGLATLITRGREIVEQLRGDALWFTVSRPESYEHGFGYGRIFKWAEEGQRHDSMYITFLYTVPIGPSI